MYGTPVIAVLGKADARFLASLVGYSSAQLAVRGDAPLPPQV